MAISDKISQVYAQALLEIAQSESKAEEVEGELRALDSALRADRIVWKFFRSPLLKLEDKIKPIENVLKLHIDKTVYNFLCVLADRRRFDYFPSIVEAYSSLVDQHLGRRKVNVESGSDLSEDQKSALVRELEGYLKKKVVLNYKANSDLIGGLYIRSDDLMIDASIKNSLALYRKTLLDRKILGEGYYEN